MALVTQHEVLKNPKDLFEAHCISDAPMRDAEVITTLSISKREYGAMTLERKTKSTHERWFTNKKPVG